MDLRDLVFLRLSGADVCVCRDLWGLADGASGGAAFLKEWKTMEYAIETQPGTVVTTLRGRLTFGDQKAFRSLLAQLSNSGVHTWVIDMRSMDYIDSAGLGLLLLVRQAATKGSATTVLRLSAEGQVRKLMDAARFGQMFTIED
jgi:anti-anti-sigma factor